jgi:hypothetical protein
VRSGAPKLTLLLARDQLLTMYDSVSDVDAVWTGSANEVDADIEYEEAIDATYEGIDAV